MIGVAYHVKKIEKRYLTADVRRWTPRNACNLGYIFYTYGFLFRITTSKRVGNPNPKYMNNAFLAENYFVIVL